MKMLLGNALFGLMMVGWFFYVDGKSDWMLAGAFLGFACFISGIFMGYLLRGPGKVRRIVQRSGPDPFAAAFHTAAPPDTYQQIPVAAVAAPDDEPVAAVAPDAHQQAAAVAAEAMDDDPVFAADAHQQIVVPVSALPVGNTQTETNTHAPAHQAPPLPDLPGPDELDELEIRVRRELGLDGSEPPGPDEFDDLELTTGHTLGGADADIVAQPKRPPSADTIAAASDIAGKEPRSADSNPTDPIFNTGHGGNPHTGSTIP